MSDGRRVACIFRSRRTIDADDEYDAWSRRIDALVTSTPGYLSHVSFRDAPSRDGVTISYFDSLEAIALWREEPIHSQAQSLGRERFYEEYTIEIVEVVRDYHWSKSDDFTHGL